MSKIVEILGVPYMTQIELGKKQASLETVESNLIKSFTTTVHQQFSNLRI